MHSEPPPPPNAQTGKILRYSQTKPPPPPALLGPRPRGASSAHKESEFAQKRTMSMAKRICVTQQWLYSCGKAASTVSN